MRQVSTQAHKRTGDFFLFHISVTLGELYHIPLTNPPSASYMAKKWWESCQVIEKVEFLLLYS